MGWTIEPIVLTRVVTSHSAGAVSKSKRTMDECGFFSPVRAV